MSVRRNAIVCDCPDCAAVAASLAPQLLAALVKVAARIDAGSGSAHWTAREHDALQTLIDHAKGQS